MVMFNLFMVATKASWNSWSLFAAFKGWAQSRLMKEGGGPEGSDPGMFFRNQGHISPAKAGFTFIACTCTSIMGRCFCDSCEKAVVAARERQNKATVNFWIISMCYL